MAKASITTKDGTTINLEGTATEVAALVEKFALVNNPPARSGAVDAPHTSRTSEATAKPTRKAKAKSGGKSRTAGVQTVVTGMIGESYFKKPKLLGEVRAGLEQGGHFYTRMAVGTALLRAVKAKELRRIKQGGQWAYVV